MAIYGLVGISGFGREVISLLKANIDNKHPLSQSVFVDVKLSKLRKKTFIQFKILYKNNFCIIDLILKKFLSLYQEHFPL